MADNIPSKKGRAIERLFLLLISVVLGLLFYDLFQVIKRDFAEVPERLANGSMVNLNGDKPDERFRTLLERGFYFEDKRDIDVITASVSQGLLTGEEAIDNIGELNKRKYYVDAEQAFNMGGASFRKRVSLSRTLIGFSGDDSVRY